MQRNSDPPSKRPAREPDRNPSRRNRSNRFEDHYVTPMWRSPIFLAIAGALVALSIAGYVMWVVVEQRSADRQFDAALTAMNDGQYEAAMEGFSTYLESFPDSEYADNAVVWRGIARIKSHTEGDSADWPQALSSAKELINDNRDLPFFRERAADVSALVAKAAVGLATTARDRTDPAAAEQAKEAVGVLERSFDLDNRNQAQIDEVFGILTQAKMAITKEDARKEALAAMDKALAAGDAMGVYTAHEQLFLRYPDLKTEPKATAIRDKARDIEKSLVEFQSTGGEAARPGKDESAAPPAVTMVRRKAAPDAKKSGQIVPVVVADTLYAVDAGSGEAIWRTPVGFEPAFAPAIVEGDAQKILAHRVTDQQLVLFETATGKEIWTKPLTALVLRNASRPAFQEGIAYVIGHAEENPERGLLLPIRISDGSSTGRFLFPQPVVAAPVVSRNQVFVLGERSSLYVLEPSQRRCEQVISLGHERDAIRCAPVIAGRFLFVAESAGLQDSLLRCLVLSATDGAPRQAQVIARKGWIWHSPYVLGGRLFLTTDHNHYSVFDLGGEEDANPLTEILSSAEVLESRGDQPYPFATSENEFWTVGNRLLSYEIRVGNRRATASWEMQLAGAPTQPPRMESNSLIVASLTADNGTVTVLAIDPGAKTEKWRLELGELPQALRADPSNPGGLLLQSGPETVPLSPDQRTTDQILERPFPMPGTARLEGPMRWMRLPEWQEGTIEWSGVGTRTLLFAPPGKPGVLIPLPAMVAARPAIMGNGLLVPGTDGLLYWIDPATGSELSEPFVAPYREGRPIPLGAVAAVNTSEAAIVLGQNLLKLRVVDQPFRHFEEIARLDLGPHKVDCLTVVGNTILATFGERVVPLPADSLHPRVSFEEAMAAGIRLGGPVLAQPAVSGARVLFLSKTGQLVCAEVVDAQVKVAWREELSTIPIDEPLLLDDSCWVPFANGKLRELRLQDGTEIRQLSAGRIILDGPWKIGESLVVVAPDGSVANINLKAN